MTRQHWFQMGRLSFLLILMMMKILPASPAEAAAGGPLAGPMNAHEVASFVDPMVSDLMAKNHVPGGAVAIVKDSRLFYAKGYGSADLERVIPVTPDQTIFRVGSISKVFTWTAVMQLAEQGKVDLNQDVNTYLTRFQIPATFPQPITLTHLMTHTAGFEEQTLDGRLFTSPEAYLPLEDFLSRKIPARIFPPGQVVAYSNYGAALAGEIVSEVSRESFEQYIQRYIFQPLDMAHSTFQQPLPTELLQEAAVGYAVDETGVPQAGSFEYIQVMPAGSLSATASDMANFMIAHLQDGRFGDTRILQAASAQEMRSSSYAFDPRLPGVTRGFAEADHNGLHFVFHAGTTERSASLLALLPEQNLGIFFTFNAYVNTDARINLLNALLDHDYPATKQIVAKINTGQSTQQFSGTYLSTRRAETNWGKLAEVILARVSVTANPDGSLVVDAFRSQDGLAKRWVPLAPLLFQESGGQGRLAFQADVSGKITAMYNGDQPMIAFQKMAWYQDPLYQIIGLGLALLVMLITFATWLLVGLIRLVWRSARHLPPLERRARWVAGGVILLLLISFGLIISVLAGDETAMQFGYPSALTTATFLALVAAAGEIALLGFTVLAWTERGWSLPRRLHYGLVMVAALYSLWYLLHVNLLAVHLS